MIGSTPTIHSLKAPAGSALTLRGLVCGSVPAVCAKAGAAIRETEKIPRTRGRRRVNIESLLSSGKAIVKAPTFRLNLQVGADYLIYCTTVNFEVCVRVWLETRSRTRIDTSYSPGARRVVSSKRARVSR